MTDTEIVHGIIRILRSGKAIAFDDCTMGWQLKNILSKDQYTYLTDNELDPRECLVKAIKNEEKK